MSRETRLLIRYRTHDKIRIGINIHTHTFNIYNYYIFYINFSRQDFKMQRWAREKGSNDRRRKRGIVARVTEYSYRLQCKLAIY